MAMGLVWVLLVSDPYFTHDRAVSLGVFTTHEACEEESARWIHAYLDWARRSRFIAPTGDDGTPWQPLVMSYCRPPSEGMTRRMQR